MGNSVLEFESVGGHGCNREAKVGEEVMGCRKMGCPDCEAARAVEQLMRSGVGTFVRARFVHWPGTDSEVVDEFSFVHMNGQPVESGYIPAGARLKVTRRKRDFKGNAE